MKLCHLLPLLLWIVMVCSKAEGKETYNVYVHKGSLKKITTLISTNVKIWGGPVL